MPDAAASSPLRRAPARARDRRRSIAPVPVYRAVEMPRSAGSTLSRARSRWCTRRARHGGWPSWSIRIERSTVRIAAISAAAAEAAGDGWEEVRGRASAQRHGPSGPLPPGCARLEPTMTTAPHRTGLGWSARLLLVLALLLAGAAGATWALARYERAAHFLGVAPEAAACGHHAAAVPSHPQKIALVPAPAADSQEIDKIEDRLAQVETTTRARGRLGRAGRRFAGRLRGAPGDRSRGRARLSRDPAGRPRSGGRHPRAVATIVTASRAPVRLDELIAEYRRARTGASRRRRRRTAGGTQFQRELGSLVEIRRADAPSTQARRALSPGAVRAGGRRRRRRAGRNHALARRRAGRAWVGKARRYVAAHRALDEIESRRSCWPEATCPAA